MPLLPAVNDSEATNLECPSKIRYLPCLKVTPTPSEQPTAQGSNQWWRRLQDNKYVKLYMERKTGSSCLLKFQPVSSPLHICFMYSMKHADAFLSRCHQDRVVNLVTYSEMRQPRLTA